MVSTSIRRWWLLAACFVTFMISAAFMQSYTVFLVAFIETFGWSWRSLGRLRGVAIRQRGDVASCRCVGRSTGTTTPRPDRRGVIGAWPHFQFLRPCLVAGGSALRDHHDARRELSWARRVRSDAVSTLCAKPGDCRRYRAIRQRLCARFFGTTNTIADRRARLALDLSGARRFHGGGYPSALSLISGNRPVLRLPRLGLHPTVDASGAIRTYQFWLLFLVYVHRAGSFLRPCTNWHSGHGWLRQALCRAILEWRPFLVSA